MFVWEWVAWGGINMPIICKSEEKLGAWGHRLPLTVRNIYWMRGIGFTWLPEQALKWYCHFRTSWLLVRVVTWKSCNINVLANWKHMHVNYSKQSFGPKDLGLQIKDFQAWFSIYLSLQCVHLEVCQQECIWEQLWLKDHCSPHEVGNFS